MTSQNEQTKAMDSSDEVASITMSDSPTAGAEGSEAPAAQGDSQLEASEPPATPADSASAKTQPPAEESLLNEEDLSGLRLRWNDVQAGFVDDPRECVQKADALVSAIVDRLTTGFSEVRSRLEAQWARGEEASTEDLRLALKRYREFFQRLLAV